jgi:hypothetical protein
VRAWKKVDFGVVQRYERELRLWRGTEEFTMALLIAQRKGKSDV